MDGMMVRESTAKNLRQFLSSYIQKQLCVLWKREGRNPALWVVRTSVILALLLGSWVGDR